MSAALNTAIFNRLTGVDGAAPAAAAALAALLATDPDTGGPAVYYGNVNDAQAKDPVSGDPVGLYPVVTYRPNAGSACHIFSDGSGAAVDEPSYDIEIWENTRNANVIENIAAQILLLLDDRKAPRMVSGGTVYSFQTLTTVQILYDQNANAWLGLWRFSAIEGV